MNDKAVGLTFDRIVKLSECVNKLDAVALGLQGDGPTETQMWGLHTIVCEVRDDLDQIKNDLDN